MDGLATMPCMADALHRQIAAYALSVAELTADEREADDLICIGLRLYDTVAALIRRWKERLNRGELTYARAQAQGFMDAYGELYRALGHVEEAARKAGIGGNVTEMARLTDVRIQLGAILKLSVDQMERAAEQFKRGEGRPLQEVRDELRRRLGA